MTDDNPFRVKTAAPLTAAPDLQAFCDHNNASRLAKSAGWFYRVRKIDRGGGVIKEEVEKLEGWQAEEARKEYEARQRSVQQ